MLAAFYIGAEDTPLVSPDPTTEAKKRSSLNMLRFFINLRLAL
jgi:hypothetical protein